MARRQTTSPWVFTVKMGLLAGVIALYIALTGMILSLSQRPVIGDILTLGHLLYLMVFAYLAYFVALRSPLREKIWPPIVQGLIVGGLGAALLALLPVIGQKVDLSFIFVTAKPNLYKFLSFGKEPGAAFLALTGLGAAVGAAFGLLAILPDFLRKAIFWSANITVLLGLLSDLARSTVLKRVIGSYFAYKGLKPGGAVVLFISLGVLLGIWFFLRSRGVVDEIRKAYQQAVPAPVRRLVMSIALGAFLLTLPVFFLQKNAYLNSVLNLVGLYIIMGLGLNIVVGFAGLLDLGYVAFFAIGAYTVALLTSTGPLGHGWNFWQALPLAVLFALSAGIILGIPVLRMRDDYLAIVTLGFGEIIRILANSDWFKPWMGGALGVLDIPKPAVPWLAKVFSWFGREWDGVLNKEWELYYLILAGILLTWFIASRLYHSRVGRAWEALREDEDVAEAMGIHLVTTKLLAFGFGAALAGMSGAIFAAKVGSVYPHSFNLIISINVLSLIIVGGVGSLPGVVVGALALVGLPELLREFAEYRMLFYGIALIAMMLLKPEGFIPRRVRVYERPKQDA